MTMTNEKTQSFMDEIFNVSRTIFSSNLDDKMKGFAALLTKNNKDLDQVIQEVKDSNRTGWKESLGGITHLTGKSVQQLNIPVSCQEKVAPFAKNENPDIQKRWIKILNEYKGITQTLAINAQA